MAVRAVNLSQILRFVSANDPDKGTPGETVFLLKPLDGFISACLQDNMISVEAGKGGDALTRINSGRVSYETIQFALQEVQNFLGEDGMPVDAKREPKQYMGKTYLAIVDSVMRQLPPSLLQEMYTWYVAEVALSAASAKKLEPQS